MYIIIIIFILYNTFENSSLLCNIRVGPCIQQ
jgi:hypothetical protein